MNPLLAQRIAAFSKSAVNRCASVLNDGDFECETRIVYLQSEDIAFARAAAAFERRKLVQAIEQRAGERALGTERLDGNA